MIQSSYKSQNYLKRKFNYRIVSIEIRQKRRGVLRISSDGDDRRIFVGLKFSIPGFFWVGKFGKYFFGWLDLSGNFLGYSKQSEGSW